MDLGLGNQDDEEARSYFHFPDGDASIARLLVRKLIPEVASGNIAIAGTDASSNAMTESAIEQAHRAVHDLPG